MTDEELVQTIERREAPAGGFHHADHVRVAWWYLRQHSLAEALGRFTATLRAFAAAQGKPGLYHETITVAFVLIIAERLAADERASWEEFSSRHRDLLAWQPSILDRYYRPETLRSDRARGGFVMPDRALDAP